MQFYDTPPPAVGELVCHWVAGSSEQDAIVTGERKSRRDMEVPHAPRGMVDHAGPDLYKPPDDRLYGRFDILATERRIPDHMEQIIGKTSDEKPCLISRKPMATRFVPLKERGHTYTPDNGGAVRLVAAEEMKQSKSVGMVERELGA